jgi:hypothetical protein
MLMGGQALRSLWGRGGRRCGGAGGERKRARRRRARGGMRGAAAASSHAARPGPAARGAGRAAAVPARARARGYSLPSSARDSTRSSTKPTARPWGWDAEAVGNACWSERCTRPGRSSSSGGRPQQHGRCSTAGCVPCTPRMARAPTPPARVWRPGAGRCCRAAAPRPARRAAAPPRPRGRSLRHAARRAPRSRRAAPPPRAAGPRTTRVMAHITAATPPMNAPSPATCATSMGSALATVAPRVATGAALRAALRGGRWGARWRGQRAGRAEIGGPPARGGRVGGLQSHAPRGRPLAPARAPARAARSPHGGAGSRGQDGAGRAHGAGSDPGASSRGLHGEGHCADWWVVLRVRGRGESGAGGAGGRAWASRRPGIWGGDDARGRQAPTQQAGAERVPIRGAVAVAALGGAARRSAARGAARPAARVLPAAASTQTGRTRGAAVAVPGRAARWPGCRHIHPPCYHEYSPLPATTPCCGRPAARRATPHTGSDNRTFNITATRTPGSSVAARELGDR